MSILLIFSACTARGPYVWVQDTESATAADATKFTIVAGDTLSIKVYNDTSISGQVKVRTDGYITLLLLGDILAAGKTPTALATELQAALSKFLNAPTVAVTVEEEQQIQVTLLGEIESPGVVELPRSAGVLSAIALGRGFTEYADQDAIFVIRQNPKVKVRFEFDDLIANDAASVNFKLRDGDIVYVE